MRIEEFTRAFGDSFVRGLQTGGEFYAVIRITSVSIKTQSSLAAALQAEANGLVASGSFKLEFNKSNQSASCRRHVRMTLVGARQVRSCSRSRQVRHAMNGGGSDARVGGDASRRAGRIGCGTRAPSCARRPLWRTRRRCGLAGSRSASWPLMQAQLHALAVPAQHEPTEGRRRLVLTFGIHLIDGAVTASANAADRGWIIRARGP
jgi:hypothetical protein